MAHLLQIPETGPSTSLYDFGASPEICHRISAKEKYEVLILDCMIYDLLQYYSSTISPGNLKNRKETFSLGKILLNLYLSPDFLSKGTDGRLEWQHPTKSLTSEFLVGQ